MERLGINFILYTTACHPAKFYRNEGEIQPLREKRKFGKQGFNIVKMDQTFVLPSPTTPYTLVLFDGLRCHSEQVSTGQEKGQDNISFSGYVVQKTEKAVRKLLWSE